MEVTAGRATGLALVPDQVAGDDDVARLDHRLGQVGVDAPIAVAVVDHDDDRQGRPEALGLESIEVRLQVADPAHPRVVVATGGKDDAVVCGHDPVAAERGQVQAVVERLAGDDARAPLDGPNGSVIRPFGSGDW